MVLQYADIDDAAALRARLEALAAAKAALLAGNPRQPLAVFMGPPGANTIPSDTCDFVIGVGTDAKNWPALVGFPASLKSAIATTLLDWVNAEMATTTAALADIGADVTGAPA